jgi:hypothetical protein
VDRPKLGVCCGQQRGDDDQLLVFADPFEPTQRRLLKKIDRMKELSRLMPALNEILSSDPDIHDVTGMENPSAH